jgi:uncharacterized protein (DUF433 family)
MQLEDYFDFNTVPVEHIRLKGTRIDIDHVIENYKLGMHPDQIATHFGCPITLDQVYATLAYYHRNKAEVEAYLERGRLIGEANYRASLKQEPTEAMKRIKAIKAARELNKVERPS